MSGIILDILRRKLADPTKLRHVSSAKNGEWCSPCPVCGGDDRFRCWPNQDGGEAAQTHGLSGTWWCRQCEKGGDIISLVQFVDGLSFRDACKELQIELKSGAKRLRPLRQPSQEKTWQAKQWPTPSAEWRHQATKIAELGHETLLANNKILSYLAGRGLPIEAVKQYKIGYLEGEDKSGTCFYRARSAFGLPDQQNKDGTRTRKSLWIPRGLTIPLWQPSWEQPDEVHRLRIRRRREDLTGTYNNKFILLEGSAQAPMVLAPKGVSAGMAVWVVVEAELDAMAVHYACDGRVGVIAVLTNLGKPNVEAHQWLSQSPLILVALDFDPPSQKVANKGRRPGYQGWLWWEQTYQQARRWPVPVGKDPGEAFLHGVDLAAWINAGLPSSLSIVTHENLGVFDFGELSAEEGEKANYTVETSCVKPEPAVPGEGYRWADARPGLPFCDVKFPKGFSYSIQQLREYYAGKHIHPELLVVCPKSRPVPWQWLYYKNCTKCSGHDLCLVDFLTSAQMFAPYVPEKVNV